MTQTISVAQMRITRDLRDAEFALDEALLKQTNLLSTMVVARRESEAGPFTGQEALLRLTKSQQSLVTAGGALARVHGSLLTVQEQVTGYVDCPPNEKMVPNGFTSDEGAMAA